MRGLSILGQDRYEDGGELYRELYEEVRTENRYVPETDGKETAEKAEKEHDSEQETAGSGGGNPKVICQRKGPAAPCERAGR